MKKKNESNQEDKKTWEDYIKDPTGIYDKDQNTSTNKQRRERYSFDLHGFALDEAAQVSVYPQFSNDGGVDSERTFVKQLVQKFINDGTTDDLFNEDELDDEYDTDY